MLTPEQRKAVLPSMLRLWRQSPEMRKKVIQELMKRRAAMKG